MQIILATRNPHKLDEIARMRPDIQWLPIPEALPDPPETGTTFVENALQKARFVYEHTGLPSLADDSGLEVDALNGRPGVHSKRYSPAGTDAANNVLLLQELAPHSNRRARYRCVLALVSSRGETTLSGTCEGVIAMEPRGSNGFGYDPLFVPLATPGRSCGELSAEEKDGLSHRGAAMRRLHELLAML